MSHIETYPTRDLKLHLVASQERWALKAEAESGEALTLLDQDSPPGDFHNIRTALQAAIKYLFTPPTEQPDPNGGWPRDFADVCRSSEEADR